MMKIYRVVELITGTKIILNCGKEQGISLWDKFEIYGLTKVLIDPETEEELGQAEIIRGRGEVTNVQDKLCTVESYLKEGDYFGSRKIIRRTNPLGSIFSGQPTTEEEITGEPRIKKFDGIQVGDYARKIE